MTHKESDMDIAVLRDRQKPAFRYVDLTGDLMEAFDSDRIDLVDLTHADPLLLFAATKSCKLLSGSQADLSDLQRLAFHRYGDYLYYLHEEKAFIQRRLQAYVAA